MLEVMRPMMSTCLKDNRNLSFAVVTGCLRIAKESIFTGTNNFVSDTISRTRLNEYFGFTQAEVDWLLADFAQTKEAEKIKAWYDGYHFGDFDIYCPWDVLNYLYDLQNGSGIRKPVSYWKNTSDNAVIRTFINHKRNTITNKMERSDVVVSDSDHDCAAVFEVKIVREKEKLEPACTAALDQIREQEYAEVYSEQYSEVRCYGIAFYKKECLIKTAH